MQLADFEALKVDLVQQEQQEEEHEEQQELLTNLTNLVHPKNSVEPAVQPDFWTTGHSVLIPDQSLQSNVVMVVLLAISILIYFSMRRPALS